MLIPSTIPKVKKVLIFLVVAQNMGWNTGQAGKIMGKNAGKTLVLQIRGVFYTSIFTRRMIRGEKVTEIGDSGDPIVVPGHGVGLGGVHDVFLLLPGRPLDPEDP